jgi:ADP-ribose pyrophosphatase
MHEKTLSARTAFRGRLLALEVQEVELENGARSVREIVRHPGAAVVLARRPDGRFALVRQFRKAVDREMTEAVAGLTNPGEPAEACARRELLEETGYAARSLAHLGTVYPSPGYVDERMEMFFAELEAEPGARSLDHDEHLTLEFADGAGIEDRIRSGAIQDAKTIAIWQLYRLRVAGPGAPR